MSYWPEFRHKGKLINLAHLEPFEIRSAATGEVERRISVTFDEHTFTRGITPEDLIDQVCFKDRIFCPIRYDLSHNLRATVETFPHVKVHQTWERRSYVYFAADIKSPTGPYHIFFSVQRRDFSKRKKGVAMHILSAYPREKGIYGDGERPNTIDFSRLVENTYMGRTIRFSR